MAETESSAILDEIQHLVSDQLQVVSYKWLSRNFSVSSDDAKRLLQDFVKRYETGTEVLYSLAGWKKDDTSLYQVSLASKHALAEAKQKFDETCSVEIYSVQACLPKDPAVLGNIEFLQAGKLFKQSDTGDNCLRDNRFCRVSNSSMRRTGVTRSSTIAPEGKSVGTLGSSAKSLANQSPNPAQPGLKKLQESSKLQSSVGVKDVNNNSFLRACEQTKKPAQDEGKVSELLVNAKKVAAGKPSGNGSSLANIWGRASSKVKTAETNCVPNSSASADAQICAREEEGASSDDEFQRVSTKGQSSGGSSRKRKVVMDYSDEEDDFEDAVNLASPDPPKKSAKVASIQTFRSSDLENNKLNFEEEKEKPSVKDGNKVDRDGDQIMKEKSKAVEDGNTKAFSLEMKALSVDKGVKNAPVGTTVKTETAPKSPQRKKVLKTRIDERGREVTEVVWEGKEETKPDTSTAKKVETPIAPSNAVNRPPANKKSPATGNITAQGGKAGNKKTQAKDPKQGNIMSFFKKKT